MKLNCNIGYIDFLYFYNSLLPLTLSISNAYYLELLDNFE